MHRSVPTVIVAQTVDPDDDEAIGVWINQLINAAVTAPGYESAAVHRPNASHENEWITIYRFSDRPTLDVWLESETREALLATGADLVTDEHVQIIAGESSGAAVRVVSSYCLVAGADPDHIVAHGLLNRSLDVVPGFVSSEVLPPVEGVQRDTVLMLTFDTEQYVHDWVESAERAAFLDAPEPIIEGDLTTNVVGSFGG